MSREALVLLVCCCDFRDGAERLIPSKSLRNAVIWAFPGLFRILRMCAPRRAAAVVRPRGREKSADRRRRILISRLLIIRASVPRRKSPFPAYFKGFPAVSPLIPPYPAFLKYPVSPQLSSKEDMATKKKAQVLVDELSKPLSYAALPMGGGQVRKSLQGIMSVVNGGKYKLNNEGEQQLQYPTYTDRPGDVPLKLAQGVLFGRTATQEAQDWIENGFKSLSVKETKAYQAITEGGEDQRKTYTFVQAIKNVEKGYDKKMLLKSYSISDTAKTAYFYQVFANEDQQKEMDKLDEQGKIDFMKKYLAEAEDNHNRDELRDAAVAGTVTQEKAIQRMVANDWAKNEDDAYWKYREWIRKADDKDYKMYDDFLNAIEAGGDVKEAAKEYLEHGKEAKDLSREVTTAYKEQYLAATPEERRKLKQKLLEIYAALGFNRKEKSKDIDDWVKDAAKEKKDK